MAMSAAWRSSSACTRLGGADSLPDNPRPGTGQDVVQEAFLQIYRSIRHFDQARPFGPWFMRSVVHAAVKAAQRTSRQLSPHSNGQTLEELLADGTSVEDQVETAEFQRQVWKALGNLTPRQRAVVVQRYFLDERKRDGSRTGNRARNDGLAAPCCARTSAQPAFGKECKMKDESIHKSLTAIARKSIPEDTNLWPRFLARLENKELSAMQLKWKVVWIILLVLLGVFVMTSVAYALYRYFNDAGMQSVNNAGLVSTVKATAQPTQTDCHTPRGGHHHRRLQTLEGVSLTINWVYLMDGQEAFGFSADGLSAGKTLGMPEMGFYKLVPEQYHGASMALKDETNPVVGTYVVNQIVRDESTFGKAETRTGVSIDIPLLGGNGQVLNTFHFDKRRGCARRTFRGREYLFDACQRVGNRPGLDPAGFSNHSSATLLHPAGWERLGPGLACDRMRSRSWSGGFHGSCHIF